MALSFVSRDTFQNSDWGPQVYFSFYNHTMEYIYLSILFLHTYWAFLTWKSEIQNYVKSEMFWNPFWALMMLKKFQILQISDLLGCSASHVCANISNSKKQNKTKKLLIYKTLLVKASQIKDTQPVHITRCWPTWQGNGH